MAVLQKIQKTFDSSIEVAIKYYSVLFLLNNIHVGEREIQLIAFTAVKGNISSGGKKEEFVKLFDSSTGSIGNMIHRLIKLPFPLLQKIDGKIKVNPRIALNFEGNVTLELNMIHDTKAKNSGDINSVK